MGLGLITIIAAQVIGFSEIKSELARSPELAGAKIKLCETVESKTCSTIDRSKEKFSFAESRTKFVDYSNRLTEIGDSLYSLDVVIQDPDNSGDHSKIQFHMKKNKKEQTK